MMPTLEEMSQTLNDMKYFTVLDYNCGFWNIELDHESRSLTCFSDPQGSIYQFKRLPFGLSMAPQVFMKYNYEHIGDLPGNTIYQDDLLIMGSTSEEHDANLQKVIERARQVNVKLNPSKVQYRLTEVKYLGHIFSAKGIELDNDRLKALEKIDYPKNKKELMRLLGVINYMRSFINNLSALTAPLRAFLKKDSVFVWTDCHTKVLNDIKDSIKNAPILQAFDPNKEIVIESDSSQNGLGC